ncbi:hypothetical protein F2P81_025608 [Scophthalmus maximus]|uniref:Uncharacterized protein n=1 Tax=Scophthalmus maximus TaxID=52904 RepID=A0A6A4RPB8_SCOMX|nr:hypothetical protein F2P81_025608 [Scophthalmus maximus]
MKRDERLWQGDCKDFNLCQTHPQKQYAHLQRPLLKVDVKNRAQLLQLPIFHNPELANLGRSFSCSPYQQQESTL